MKREMKLTYLVAALMLLVGYLAIRLADARMGLDTEIEQGMEVQ